MKRSHTTLDSAKTHVPEVAAVTRCSAADNTNRTVRRRQAIAGTLLSILLLASPGVPVRANDARVQSAVDTYLAAMGTPVRDQRLRQFALAEQQFRQIIEGDRDHPPVENADLYTNLGNAALQAEHMGAAIIAYRRALRLAPQHAAARQNLAYVRSLLPEWIRYAEPHRLWHTLFFWSTWIPRRQMALLGAVLFLWAALLFAIGHARDQVLLRNSALVPLLGWLALSLSLLASRDVDSTANVVLLTESVVYTADSENSPPRLARPLPDGAELALQQERSRWSEVRLADGRTGWVLSSALERIGD